jgi:hypothetical protein
VEVLLRVVSDDDGMRLVTALVCKEPNDCDIGCGCDFSWLGTASGQWTLVIRPRRKT